MKKFNTNSKVIQKTKILKDNYLLIFNPNLLKEAKLVVFIKEVLWILIHRQIKIMDLKDLKKALYLNKSLTISKLNLR